MAESNWLLSPEMRLLAGDAFEPQKKDKMGNPMTVKNGPNAGQPTQSFVLTCGIAKTDPAAIPYLLQIGQAAARAWPKYFPQGAQPKPPLMGCVFPSFAIKIQDGDGLDGDGKSNAAKEGYAGNWIVKFSQPSAIEVFEVGHYADVERLDIDINKPKRSMLKRGYFVRVYANFQSNEIDTKPGMYANPKRVEVIGQKAGFGEITSGPSAESVFGGGTIDHSATPGLKMTGAYTYEALKAGGWSDDAMIAAGHAVRQAPPAAPLPPVPSTPAAPAALVMTGAYTHEALKAGGWSDDQMIAAGHATRPASVVAAPLPPSPAASPVAPAAPIPPASTTHGTAGVAGAPPPPSVTPSPSSYTGFMQAPAGPTLTAAAVAQGYTYDALKGAGWTDAQMIQQGLLQS